LLKIISTGVIWMKKTLKIQLSVALALIICCVANISVFSNQCDSIRDKMLRMHVIANSDSEEDQNLKLKVRDAVLTKGKEIFDGSITADEAEEKIKPHIAELEETALISFTTVSISLEPSSVAITVELVVY
jgi:stage II sporulation protein R